MIRLFNKTAERVALMVNSLKLYAPQGITVSSIANDYYGGADNRLYSEDIEVHDRLMRIAKANLLSNQDDSIDSIVECIIKQLYSENDHRELIDEIARILNMPRGHMVLGGQALTALQRAILIPEEIRSFRRAIAEGSRCYQCGTRIVAGEVCTTLLAADGIPFLACAVCAHPQAIRCATPNCDQKITFKQYVPGKTYFCKEHNMEAKLSKSDAIKISSRGYSDTGATITSWATAPDDGPIQAATPIFRAR